LLVTPKVTLPVGKILERQRDRVSAESKYRIHGRTLDGEEVERPVGVASFA
jgi:hypothetical protein